MSHYDLIIRGGTVVTHEDESRRDIGISGEQIVAIAPELPGNASQVIDATGFHIFPGLIDSHVHFNDPGRATWEGIATGSLALAAGGGTLFFDMPLNAHPPTLGAESFDQKLAVARKKSLVDFAFWGGLTPGNLDQLEALCERGVVGFKAFMCDSGIDDFPMADDKTLRAGMKQAARLNRIVAVHAESQRAVQTRTSEIRRAGKTGATDFLASRPIQAELEAIGRAIELAGETNCALHIVHVSCGAGVALVASARKHGVNVSCETCPHYLLLTEEDVQRIGAAAKCAPPLRAPAARESLWQFLRAGEISTIGSDHSPAPPEMKQDSDFFNIWGGISSVQFTLLLLLTEGGQRGLPHSRVVQLTSHNVAGRFKLPDYKGHIRPGADADLALVDLAIYSKVEKSGLLYRHPHCPYFGRELTGRVRRTILRGRTIFQDGRAVSTPCGRLARPSDCRRNDMPTSSAK
jgi:allantoinase